MDNQKRITEINALIKAEIQKGCKACNSVGAYHCAHPDECGQWDEVLKLEKEREKLLIKTDMTDALSHEAQNRPIE